MSGSDEEKVVATHRRARFEYDLLERFDRVIDFRAFHAEAS